MNNHVGILLDENTKSMIPYFNQHIHIPIQYYFSYEQFLMQCEVCCEKLLMPLSYSKSIEVLHQAEQLNIETYNYYFKHPKCFIYKLENATLSSILDEQRNMLCLQRKKQQLRIPMHEILYLVSDRNYTHICTHHKVIKMRMCLSELYSRLDPEIFFRCHQSYVVNLYYIYSLQRYEAVLQDRTSIPVSKANSQQLRKLYKQLYPSK